MATPIYRARDGKILGVCQGIARYRDIPVHYLRLGLVLFTLFSGFWLGLAIYIVAALMLKPEPFADPAFGPGAGACESAAFTHMSTPRHMALAQLGDRLHRLTSRIQVLEDRVTREDYAWERRLRTPPPGGLS